MRKYVRIKQHDQSDCGATCLASVMAYYGLQMPISRVRQLSGTDKNGTNILGLVETAEKCGFACKGVKATDTSDRPQYDVLHKVPTPTIAHIISPKNIPHFVVVYKVRKNHVIVMDPADGELVKYGHDEFLSCWTGVLVLLVPDETFVPQNEKISVLQRFWYLFKPHKHMFLQALTGALAYTVLGLVSSVCVQKIIDYVIPDGNSNLLNLLCICMLLTSLLSAYIGFQKSRIMMRTGVVINSQLILGYYRHLLKLPQSFFDSMRSGELISRIGDAAQINLFITHSLVSIVVNVFTLLAAFLLMFSYYWKLALIMLASIPVYAIIFYTYNLLNKKIQRKQMEDAAELEVQLVESINASSTIKSFGIEAFTNVKTENKFIKLTHTAWNSGVIGLFTDTFSNTFSTIFVTILLWLGTTYVIDGVITPGELMSFHTLTGYFMGPVISIVGVNRVYQNARIAADRLFEIFDIETDFSCKEDAVGNTINGGNIKFEDVSFHYGAREDIFRRLNIEFIEGQVSAIVGESGSGKTTIISLIQKLYKVQNGRILIGNMDINTINPHALRNKIGVVPQKIDLFNGSIADNIILDDFSPNWDRFHKVCNETGVSEFAEKMPQGINTIIGENGSQLSGGQRQRLAIARALYRDPEIIILDEATSALDSASERNIKNIIYCLKKQKKTIILIAHRLGTVLEADTIYVLDKGELVEQGNHNELLARHGLYLKYWTSQTETKNEQ